LIAARKSSSRRRAVWSETQKSDLSYFIIVNSRDGLMASHTWITWQWNKPAEATPTYQSFGFYANIIERAQAVLHPPGRC
jgi:hypothetical protein